MIKTLSQLEFLVEQLPNASIEQLPYFTEQFHEILKVLKAKGHQCPTLIHDEELSDSHDFFIDSLAELCIWEYFPSTQQFVFSDNIINYWPDYQLGNRLEDIFLDSGKEVLKRCLSKAISTKKGFEVVLQANERGENLWLEVSAHWNLANSNQANAKEEVLMGIIRAMKIGTQDLQIINTEESANFAYDLLAGISDGFVVINQDWIITYANEQLASSIQTTVGQLIGKNVWQTFPEFSSGPFQATCQDVMTNRQMKVMVNYFTPWNTWFQNRIFPASNGIAIFSTNITYEKRLEQSLIKSEAELESLVENIPYGVFSLDLSFRLLKYNGAFRNFWLQKSGAEPQVGIPLPYEICSVANLVDCDIFFQDAIRGKSTTIERKIEVSNSEQIFEISINPSYNTHHDVVGITVLMNNITSRKQTEQILLENQQRYQSLFDQNPDGVFSLDFEGKFTSANAALADILEYPIESLLKCQVSSFSELAFSENLQEILQKTLEGTSQSIEIGIYTGTGIPKRVHLTSMPIVLNGQLQGVYGIVKDITSSFETSQAIVANEQKWKRALEGSLQGVWDWRVCEQKVHYSKIWKELIGYEENEIGESFDEWSSRVHPEDIDRVLTSVQQLIVDEIQYFEEIYRFRHKKNHYIWVLDRGVVMERNTQKEPIRVVGTLSDISQLKEVEEQLLKSEKNLTDAQKIARIGSWELELQKNSLVWSDEVFSLFGLDKKTSNATFETFLQCVHPDDKDTFLEAYHQVFTGKERLNIEHRIVLPTGEIRYIHERGELITNESGQSIAIKGTSQDITERKQIELSLLQERNFLKIVIDNIPAYIYYKDTEHRHLLVNKSGLDLFGVSKEESLLHQSGLNLLEESSANLLREQEEYVMSSGNAVTNIKEYFLTKSGQIKWLLSNKVPLHDTSGEVIGVVGVSRDITDSVKKELEQEHLWTISRKLNEIENLQVAIYESLRILAYYLDCVYAEAWMLNLNHSKLNLHTNWFADESVALDFTGLAFQDLKRGEFLPGMAWATQRIQEWDLSHGFIPSTEKRIIEKLDCRSGVALPIMFRGQVIAVFCFYSTEEHISNATDFFDNVSRQIGVDLSRRKAEDELNIFFNSSPDFLCMLDADFCFTKLNKVATEWLYGTEQSLMGKSVFDYVYESDKEKTQQQISLLAQTRQVGYFENRILKDDGEVRWLAWTVASIKEQDRVIAAAKDITEKKHSDQHLSLYKQLLDNMNDLVCLWSPEGKPIYVNKSFYEFAGDFTDIVDKKIPLLEEPLAQNIFDAVLNGKHVSQDVVIYDKEEDWIDYYVSAGPIADENNQIVSLFTIFTDISERKKHERDLEQYNVQITNILESITDGFFAVNHQYTVTYMNAEAERLLGMSRNFLINENLWDTFGHGAPLSYYSEYTRAIEENVSVSFDDYYAPGRRWFHINAYPSENGLSIFFRDVTEQKLKEQLDRIEKAALEYNTLQDTTLAQVLEYYINEVQELQGRTFITTWQVEGKELKMLVDSNLDENLVTSIETFGFSTNPNEDGEYTSLFFPHKQFVKNLALMPQWQPLVAMLRAQRIKACWSMPIVGAANKIIGILAYFFNDERVPSREEEVALENVKRVVTLIMESKLAELALRESNERYNLVAKATNDLIWDLDIETNEILWSDSISQILGYSLQEITGDYYWWLSKVHPDDAERVNHGLRKHLVDKKLHWEDEYRILCADYSYKFVYDRGFTLYDENNNPVRMIGAIQDVSPLKKTELKLNELNIELEKRASELVASNEELERFAYVASHDLQEPLRMVSSFLQLLQKKYDTQLDDQAKKYIYFAVNGSERMKQLILDLLEYSRVGTNREAFILVDLNEVVTEVMQIYDEKIKKEQATVLVGKLPIVDGNRVQLLQLVQNLIGNALKYRREKDPIIKIELEETENDWIFSFSDNGIGIDSAYFKKIFIIFQRLHSKTEYSGTGIGLAICKKIVERHRGRMWVESIVGEGSTFRFTLPKNKPKFLEVNL
ncbi:PAS domain S-box protein [Flectobacillus sp. DC10W]|uniref:histidine kinase n=1 Tax=Flectobacillus longus TaxID=2984207 RepID=A0ABT6YSE6_9BACT|nr:PAS domain S-box protein [Flectobacillus longus]MDI9866522.1 PAS domain S-box protein [Flectobacillus longus]